jgi:hypothetical protein
MEATAAPGAGATMATKVATKKQERSQCLTMKACNSEMHIAQSLQQVVVLCASAHQASFAHADAASRRRAAHLTNLQPLSSRHRAAHSALLAC